jgi:hypothetical protein
VARLNGWQTAPAAAADRLVPCTACSRHVRHAEVACPFCGASLCACTPSGTPTGPRESFQRLAAAAAVAAGVAAVTSCGSASPSSVSFYGSPGFPEDASGGDSIGSSSASSSGLPPYGGPFVALDCMSSASCLPGEVCCLEDSPQLGSSCQTGPCPSTQFGPVQLCGVSDECLAPGDVCTMSTAPLPAEVAAICSAPGDGGNQNDGGIVDADASGSDGDASPSEAEAGDEDGGTADDRSGSPDGPDHG